MADDLATRYKGLTTGELVRIVHFERASYTADALAAAEAELATRGTEVNAAKLQVQLDEIKRELRGPRPLVPGWMVRVISVLFPVLGLMIAGFEWAKDRNDRAAVAAKWSGWSILVQLALTVVALALPVE